MRSPENPLNGPVSKARTTQHRRPAPQAVGRRIMGRDALTPPPAGPVPATTLSTDELEYFRRLLLEKRRELSGDVNHMADEALGNSRSEACGDLSMMPLHLADIGTDQYEREFTLGLMQSERQTLEEIDAALARIREGTYGVCLGTHKPIAKARLAVKPWARYSIAHSRLLESRGRHSR